MKSWPMTSLTAAGCAGAAGQCNNYYKAGAEFHLRNDVRFQLLPRRQFGYVAKSLFENAGRGRARLLPSLAEPAPGGYRRGSAGASPYRGRHFQTRSN
jgi:hypothetical protein